MARINLLPWRQEARERKNREFLTLLAGVLLLSLLAAGAAWSYFNNTLDSQIQANEKIKQENVKLDKQLTEIASLEKQRDEMLTQMKVIQDLQGRRPIPVRVWNDIAKVIPPQMYLINMKREGDVITFKGKADNPNVVADFIRNLDASPWLENSAVKSIMQPQATAYAPAPASAPATTGNTNGSAPRPVYPEDNYVEFVVTSVISKTSDLEGSASSTVGTKVVTTTTTTTSATATTVIPASSVPVTSAPVAVPASTTKPVPTSTPAISNAPVAPVTNTTIKTTTTTTKERSNG